MCIQYTYQVKNVYVKIKKKKNTHTPFVHCDALASRNQQRTIYLVATVDRRRRRLLFPLSVYTTVRPFIKMGFNVYRRVVCTDSIVNCRKGRPEAHPVSITVTLCNIIIFVSQLIIYKNNSPVLQYTAVVLTSIVAIRLRRHRIYKCYTP